MSQIEAAFMGVVARDAEPKTSKAGKQYLRFTVRIGAGDTAQFVSVMYFGSDITRGEQGHPRLRRGQYQARRVDRPGRDEADWPHLYVKALPRCRHRRAQAEARCRACWS
jgi:hypothetical protein